ncbi:MAG TPA: Calx-beta domain-containing protein [Pyrinomonadaceae bacterium]|nr:Calx-beta domain-containing protein [Pyrinomonadaceae bacterium]
MISPFMILTVTMLSLLCSYRPAATVLSPQGTPHVTITATTANAFEDGFADGVFRISRDGATTEPLTVHLEISGTATNGVDYLTIPNEVQIPAGASSTELRVKPIDDTQLEEDEAVNVGIADVPINSSFNGTLAAVTIKDNDTVVQIETVDPNGAEAGQHPITFRITRSGNFRRPLTVDLMPVGPGVRTPTGSINPTLGDGSARTVTIADGTSNTVTFNAPDVATPPTSVTFQIGESAKLLNLTPIDDSVVEGQESITVNLAPSHLYTIGANRFATGFIADNDNPLPVVQISTVDANGSEAGPHPIVFSITRTGDTSTQITVNYSVNPAATGSITDGTSNTIVVGENSTATSGVDFTPLSGNVTLLPGESSKQLTITPIDDAVVEARESVTIGLLPGQSYVLGTNRRAVGFVDDNDQPIPLITIAVTQASASEEGPTPATVTVTRTGPTTQSLTVYYAINDPSAGGTANFATNGVDFTSLPGQVVIPSGASSATITIRPIPDKLLEGDERVVLQLLTQNPPAYITKIGGNQVAVVIKDLTRP